MSSEVIVGAAVPVYNGERFVAAAVRSVLAQSHPVGDVVVVDDGSDDASAAVASGVGPPVRVVRQPHAGIGAARSHAVSLVRGEFIVLLDADDLLTPRSVEARLRALRKRDYEVGKAPAGMRGVSGHGSAPAWNGTCSALERPVHRGWLSQSPRQPRPE
ncbi:MAG: glycosyltransferase family 2 protein [Solirubrobacteraceae bacterium]|jgi:glycosyltransferase involved in cell wall biosynthesis